MGLFSKKDKPAKEFGKKSAAPNTKVNVIVSCGSGLVTSALMEQGLIDIVEANDLNVKITKIGMTSIPSYLPDSDILVTTGEYSADTGEVVKLTGTPILDYSGS